ncbi:unnamed protein product [Rotaria magnacalcarata]|uniref:Uncharacterized protein n=1 Tax=Rotaria magnacalcarata TaxID=392030 RepID=A0A819JPR3_9BILA|nr:unnamed protein product [Rotaria magnacalcarata]CAF3860049.1 unnamed protein product [Rotaria magnacalcarata]CAF3933959.1 unnamed protein product [Rotaria magnacalcarata]
MLTTLDTYEALVQHISNIEPIIRLVFAILSVLSIIILSSAKNCHDQWNNVNYVLNGVKSHRYQIILKWQHVVLFQSWGLIIVLAAINQLSIDSLVNTTFSWAINIFLAFFIEFMCRTVTKKMV